MITQPAWEQRRLDWWSKSTSDATAEITAVPGGTFDVAVQDYHSARRSTVQGVATLERAKELGDELLLELTP